MGVLVTRIGPSLCPDAVLNLANGLSSGLYWFLTEVKWTGEEGQERNVAWNDRLREVLHSCRSSKQTKKKNHRVDEVHICFLLLLAVSKSHRPSVE